MRIIYSSRMLIGGVSLFASQDFVFKIGLCIAANLILLAEIHLVGVLVLLALEGASEFSLVHFIFVAVARIHSVMKRR